MMDLHTHSTHSDGSLTPEELVGRAQSVGVTHLALCDHDCIDGLREAESAAKGAGVAFIAGVELDVAYEGEMHILGLGIRDDAGFRAWLKEIESRRAERNRRIIQKFDDHGMALLPDLPKRPMGLVSRTHIAYALVQRGKAKNITDAFQKYMVKGRIAYDTHQKPSLHEALSRIGQVGGKSVLAHPGKLSADLEKAVQMLALNGLWGLEVFYPAHNRAKRESLLALCAKYRLMPTCGSDFHGAYRPGVNLGMAWEDNAQLCLTRELLFSAKE